MAGRHRRPPGWRRALSRVTNRRTGVRAARLAALQAEVLALRAAVTTLRADLDLALAGRAELASRLAAEQAELASRLAAEQARAQEAAAAVPPPVTLELPLVRLAMQRTAEPPLTREMAAALATPDRGEDTAVVRIVLEDLPERALLDPRQDREGDLRDLAAEIVAAPQIVRRTA